MRIIALSLPLIILATACGLEQPGDGVDPDGNGTDTTSGTPPAGSTTAKIEFDAAGDVRGVKIYCQKESDLLRGAILFVDGNEVVNVLKDGPLGTVASAAMTVDNTDSTWCQGFVTTESNPPVWNKLLIDDRGNPNNPVTHGQFTFDDWSCGAKRLVHNEPPSADNSWDTQWGNACSW